MKNAYQDAMWLCEFHIGRGAARKQRLKLRSWQQDCRLRGADVGWFEAPEALGTGE
jgi:hypothetical protein